MGSNDIFFYSTALFFLTQFKRLARWFTLLSGNNSAVECNLAKVEVASSNLVSRSNKKGGIAKW